MTSPQSNSTAIQWPPSFRGGVLPAVVLLLAFTVWIILSSTAFRWIFEQDSTLLIEGLWSIPSGLVQFGIAAAVYRHDGVNIREIGLSGKLLKPAAVGVVGVVIAVNTAVIGLAVLASRDISVGLYAFYQTDPYNLSLSVIVTSLFTIFCLPARLKS